MLALRKEVHSPNITVPLPMPNSSGPWRNSTFSRISKKFADGGPRRKTEKFWQIERIIGDLHELDNFRHKFLLKKKF